ncbi:MAG: hypothetical protein GTO22_00690 [Gemmatimonadales bacterium]|nr:hypothetical protein [Gemmatimonadales bacterium]
MRWYVPFMVCCFSACAAGVLRPGSTQRGHKLLAVDSGVVLASLPVQINCPGWDGLDSFTRSLAPQDVRVHLQFTVAADGGVDRESVVVARSTHASINDAAIEFVTSCMYHPALTTDGQQTWARVEWQLIIRYSTVP